MSGAETFKRCSVCGIVKPLSDFYANKHGLYGKRVDCKVCNAERRREHHLEHLEREKARSKQYRLENRDRDSAQRKVRYINNIEHEKAISKQNYIKNREWYRAYSREYYRSNPARTMERLRARKARIKGNGGVLTESDWQEVLDRYGNICLRCGATENITRDHVLPISKGGRNDKYNIQPLCSHCNDVKFTRSWDFRCDIDFIKGAWHVCK